jgi:hypothetical protein
VVTAGIAVGAATGLAAAAGGPRWLALGWLAPAGYTIGILLASLAEARGLPPRARVWLPAVLATMHTSWGLGFVVGSRATHGSDADTPTAPVQRSEP